MTLHANIGSMTATKKCARCPSPARSGQAYCGPCHNAYMRDWRAGREPSEVERRRDITRSYTHVLIRRGKLKREPCSECGVEPAHAHHPDYTDPWNVVWLCPPHHRSLHRALRAGDEAPPNVDNEPTSVEKPVDGEG